MNEEKKVNADAYRHYLLGYLIQVLSAGYKAVLVRDIDGNPGHIEVTVPGEVTLQVLIKTIPEDRGSLPARVGM